MGWGGVWPPARRAQRPCPGQGAPRQQPTTHSGCFGLLGEAARGRWQGPFGAAHLLYVRMPLSRRVGVAEGVARGAVHAKHGHDVAGRRLLDVLQLVSVHAHQARHLRDGGSGRGGERVGGSGQAGMKGRAAVGQTRAKAAESADTRAGWCPERTAPRHRFPGPTLMRLPLVWFTMLSPLRSTPAGRCACGCECSDPGWVRIACVGCGLWVWAWVCAQGECMRV